MTETIKLVSEYGMMLVIVGALLWFGIKYFPILINAWKDDRQEQKEYYQNRQNQYDRQMDILVGIMNQGNRALECSNEVIRRNNDVIEANTKMHEKVIQSLEKDLEGLDKMGELIERHDRRSENMNIDIVKIKEALKK